jgi:hypothetical protein
MLQARSTLRIAIIGAGVVGCTLAWKLRASLQCEVDLFERRDDILLETTAGTSNRLHYGYQYALSDETARTLSGYHHQFAAVYGDCVTASANYYGIAADSELSCLQYLNFCARCQLPVQPAEPAAIFTDRVLRSLLSAERSIDVTALRRICWQKLTGHGVNVFFSKVSPAMLQGYDYVISTVYADPNLLADAVQRADFHFGLCEMMVVKLPERYREISAMIVYGRFMTVDVLHGTDYHVLYCGTHGMLGAQVGKFPVVPDAYRSLLYRTTPAAELRGRTRAALALRAAGRYFQGLEVAEHIASSFVIRVQSPSDVPNAVRRTTLSELKDSWFSISASKISSCVTIADQMIDLIRRREAGRMVAVGL